MWRFARTSKAYDARDVASGQAGERQSLLLGFAIHGIENRQQRLPPVS